jgi:quercetin dioxygenase-like cupin family protein
MSDNPFNFEIIQEKLGKNIATLTNSEKIELAEYHMLNNMEGATTVSPPLEHFICNGTYVRKIELPAGMLLTGKVHNFDHTSTLIKGRVTVMTMDGIEHRQAGDIWISKAGTKRLIYVHEDTIWTTTHRSEHTEVEDLEKELCHASDLTWIKQLLLPGGDK